MATGPGVNQGKTAFLEEFLPGRRDSSMEAVNKAWTAAGNEGTISESLLGKIRGKLGLTGNQGTSGGAAVGSAGSAAKGKAKSPKDKKSTGATSPRAASKSEDRLGQNVGGSPNKTAFIKEALGQDSTLNAKAIRRAWTEAGNEGSISDNLYYSIKAALGIKRERASSRETVAGADQPTSAAAETAITQSDRLHAVDAGHGRDLHEIEGEIDELMFRLKGLGSYAEVQEALRAARRMLVRSHGE